MKENLPAKAVLRRGAVMILGIFCIGVAVGFYRLGRFGVDAGTCMNLGISLLAEIPYGTLNVIVNVVVLAGMFFYFRKGIGVGTVVNLVLVGYIADFVCWLVQDVLALEVTLPLRAAFFLAATGLATFGTAVYLDADMGVAPYDALSLMLQKALPRISFRIARVAVDVCAVVIGTAACMFAKDDLSLVIGLGTVVAAFANGFMIQFFRKKVSPLLLGTRDAS